MASLAKSAAKGAVAQLESAASRALEPRNGSLGITGPKFAGRLAKL